MPEKLAKPGAFVHRGTMPRIARPTVRRCPWKKDRWIVDGLRDDQGRRFRKFFESREDAKTWLANHREKSLVEGRAGLSFTDAQRADARRALVELASFKACPYRSPMNAISRSPRVTPPASSNGQSTRSGIAG